MLEDELSEEMLKRKTTENASIHVSVKGEKGPLTFRFEPKEIVVEPLPEVATDGDN